MRSALIILMFIFSFLISSSYILAQESNKFYALTFNYEKTQEKETLTFVQIEQHQGTLIENELNPTATYKWEIISFDGAVLESGKFSTPASAAHVEDIKSGTSAQTQNFRIYVPYYENAALVNIYDSNDKKVLDIPLQSAIVAAETEQQNTDDGGFNWAYIGIGVVALTLVFLAYLEFNRAKGHRKLGQQSKNQSAAALRNYVLTNLRRGYAKEQIRNALIKNSYSNQEIEEAFGEIR